MNRNMLKQAQQLQQRLIQAQEALEQETEGLLGEIVGERR